MMVIKIKDFKTPSPSTALPPLQRGLTFYVMKDPWAKWWH